MAEPLFVYLDTNGVEDFSVPRPPVDAAMRGRLLAAVEDGRLVFPFSEAVAQEIAATSLRDRDKMRKLAAFYLKIVSFDHALEITGTALRRVIGERLGEVPVSPFTKPSPNEKKAIRRRLQGRTDDIAGIMAKYRREAETWTTNSIAYRDTARDLLLALEPIRTAKLADAVRGVWEKLAPFWASGLVESRGWLERAREQGLTDEQLLRIPGVRAAVGASIGLAVAQTQNGRNPHLADYGDSQHTTLAACAGLPLVTHDGALRSLIDAIPDPPVEVIAPADLLARCA